MKGWNNRSSVPKEFKLDGLKNYLEYYTVAGYTRSRATPIPEVVVRQGGTEAVLKTGFPYIRTTESNDVTRTVIFGPLESSQRVRGN